MSESDKTFTFFEDVALKDIRTDVTPSQILIWAAMNTDENGSIKLSELRKALLK